LKVERFRFDDGTEEAVQVIGNFHSDWTARDAEFTVGKRPPRKIVEMNTL